MDVPLVLGFAAVVLVFVVVRHLAARRVLAGQGQFIWLMFLPTLIGGVVILWGGSQMSTTVPIAGLLMAMVGAVYLALVLQFLIRTSRSVSAAGPQDDIGTVLMDQFAEYVSKWTALFLVGGLVAVAGLVVWGVTQAR